jgi:hypothetical protein
MSMYMYMYMEIIQLGLALCDAYDAMGRHALIEPKVSTSAVG